MNDHINQPNRATPLGTPCARAWGEEWIARVETREAALNRRICGAVGLDGEPCERTSNHPNGRCPHHGGNHLIGAPSGNRNAVLHGLYARRLMPCGAHCARWQSCPYAAEDIMELPAAKRPTCLYEQLEYDALLQAYLSPQTVPEEEEEEEPEALIEVMENGVLAREPFPDPNKRKTAKPVPAQLSSWAVPVVHTTVLLQVMASRAAAALGVQQVTVDTVVESKGYRMETTKTNPALEALLRITRELRRHQEDLRHYVREAHIEASKPLAIEIMELHDFLGKDRLDELDVRLQIDRRRGRDFYLTWEEQAALIRAVDEGHLTFPKRDRLYPTWEAHCKMSGLVSTTIYDSLVQDFWRRMAEDPSYPGILKGARPFEPPPDV